MTTTPKDQMPINGPYYTPEQRNKIGKKLDKAFNERIDMDIPKDQPTKTIWYEANTGNHQGLIINETNGDNIAVTYKKEDAALIAKAVNCHDELVESLTDLINEIEKHHLNSFSRGDLFYNAKQALAKVEGGG